MAVLLWCLFQIPVSAVYEFFSGDNFLYFLCHFPKECILFLFCINFESNKDNKIILKFVYTRSDSSSIWTRNFKNWVLSRSVTHCTGLKLFINFKNKNLFFSSSIWFNVHNSFCQNNLISLYFLRQFLYVYQFNWTLALSTVLNGILRY